MAQTTTMTVRLGPVGRVANVVEIGEQRAPSM